MEAKELRIGNLLKDAISGQWLIVDHLEAAIIGTKVINRSKYPLPDGWYLEPIPLTPEILEKARFSYNEFYDNYRIQIDEYFYSVKQIGTLFTFSNDSSDASCYIITELSYLHELQNLVFSIAKKELEINL